jgi:hypothetical protein
MSLTNLACKNAKAGDKALKLSDSAGLFLYVMPGGAKYWRMKYRFQGKENRLALGVYPDTSLEEARQKRERAKKLLTEGKDPSDVKKQEKLVAKVAYDNTFENIAREWCESQKALWVASHSTRIVRRLEKDVFPKLGFRPISEITAPNATPRGDLRGALKAKKVKNHAYLKENELPEYLAKLELYDGHPQTELYYMCQLIAGK